jgi:carboxymethylenebutenolidase
MPAATIPSLPDPESVRAQWVAIPVTAAGVPPTTLRAWWSRPVRAPLRGAVLVLPEVFGVNGWVRSVADRLAGQGYAALAIPSFARTAPELDLGYDDQGLSLGREHRDRVTASAFLADAGAAVRWLQQTLEPEGLADQPLGCVGFCFGGHLALLAATLPAIGATCAFYGARVSLTRPGGGPPTLEVLPQIPGRLWCFVGAADPLIPAEEVEAIRGAMTEANDGTDPQQPKARHRLWYEPLAGHGYLCEARADFRPAEAARAWKAMLQVFSESLTRA